MASECNKLQYEGIEIELSSTQWSTCLGIFQTHVYVCQFHKC